MDNIIIITGHGNYATGLLSSIEMISGKNEKIYAIDFLDNSYSITDKFEEIINSNPNSNILFVCDMIGGTPFKEASKIAFNNTQIEVVSGCNLGALIQVSLMLNTSNIKDICNNIIELSKKNVIMLEKNKLTNNIKNNGI